MTRKENLFVTLAKKAVGLKTTESACCSVPTTKADSTCCTPATADGSAQESCCTSPKTKQNSSCCS
jgi:hypothetical protein